MTPDTNNERAAAFAQACQDLGAIAALLGFDKFPGVDPVLARITDLIVSEPPVVAKAPAAEPVATVYTMEALVPGGSVKHHVQLLKPLTAGTNLYTAPPAPTEQWVSVEERPLPACATLDVYGRQYGDKQLGRRVYVTYTGTRPLETTEDEEITHYRERPAPPQGAAMGAT